MALSLAEKIINLEKKIQEYEDDLEAAIEAGDIQEKKRLEGILASKENLLAERKADVRQQVNPSDGSGGGGQAGQATEHADRSSQYKANIQQFKSFLEDLGINPSPGIMDRILRDEKALVRASQDKAAAQTVYEHFKKQLNTSTKECLGRFLRMKVNGSPFENVDFILSAHNEFDVPCLVKVLRPCDLGENVAFAEAHCVRLKHDYIVQNMDHQTIKLAENHPFSNKKGNVSVLIMPWYASTLNQHPTNCLEWIGKNGSGVLNALKYMHGEGLVHMDVKASNIFVDGAGHWFLGDFGSCKNTESLVESCTIQFCYENVFGKPAHPKYDYFMLLVMLLSECEADRKSTNRFYTSISENHEQYASSQKVHSAAIARINASTEDSVLNSLLNEVCVFLKAAEVPGF